MTAPTSAMLWRRAFWAGRWMPSTSLCSLLCWSRWRAISAFRWCEIAATITASLAMRPVGAFFFGLMADRYGRRWPLMLDIVFYSVVEVLSGLAPNYQSVFRSAPALRNRYGRGVGGGGVVGHGIGFPQVARHPVGIVAGRLCVWKPPGGGGLFPGIPALGLARHVFCGGIARPAFTFHLRQGEGDPKRGTSRAPTGALTAKPLRVIGNCSSTWFC